jgi:hypothetical protein
VPSLTSQGFNTVGKGVYFEMPEPEDSCPRIQSLKSEKTRVAEDHNDRLFFGKRALRTRYDEIEAEIDSIRKACRTNCPGVLGEYGLQRICGVEFMEEAAQVVEREVQLLMKDNQQ